MEAAQHVSFHTLSILIRCKALLVERTEDPKSRTKQSLLTKGFRNGTASPIVGYAEKSAC